MPSTADGTRRSTTKSKLKEILFSGMEDTCVDENSSDQRKDILLVDTMALINTMMRTPTTYFALAEESHNVYKLHHYNQKLQEISDKEC